MPECTYTSWLPRRPESSSMYSVEFPVLGSVCQEIYSREILSSELCIREKNVKEYCITVHCCAKITGELYHNLDSALFWNLMKVQILIGLKIRKSVRHISNVTVWKNDLSVYL